MLFHYLLISNIGNLIFVWKAWIATFNYVRQLLMLTDRRKVPISFIVAAL